MFMEDVIMKYLPLIWIPLLLLGSCTFFTEFVEGDGNLVVRHIVVDDFQEIEHAGIGRIIVTQSQGESTPVTIITEKNILEHLNVRTSGRTLVVSQDECVMLKPSQEPIFLVSLPVIDRLHLTGAGDIVTDGIICGTKIRIILEGAGDIRADLDVTEVIAALSGAGNIILNGSSTASDLSIIGAGDILASELDTNYCSATIPGAGDIHVQVKDRLDAVIYGAGDIFYSGTAIVDAKIFGAGSVVYR
jgi:hypothetical protein